MRSLLAWAEGVIGIALALVAAGCNGDRSIAGPEPTDAAARDLAVPAPVDAAAGPPIDPGPTCNDDAQCQIWQICVAGHCEPWTPARLQGLALWLDPDQGIEANAGNVIAWRDRSGHGNDAIAIGTVGLARGAIGGHDAARFDGTGYLDVADAPSLRFGLGAFTVASVARYSNRPNLNADDYNYAMFYIKANVHYPFAGAALMANTNYFWLHCGNPVPSVTGLVAQVESCVAPGAVGSGRDNDGAFHLFGMRRESDGVELSVLLDGAPVARQQVPAVDVSAPTYHAEIGGRAFGAQQLAGDIAELVVAGEGVTARDLARLTVYVRHKYGL